MANKNIIGDGVVLDKHYFAGMYCIFVNLQGFYNNCKNSGLTVTISVHNCNLKHFFRIIFVNLFCY